MVFIYRLGFIVTVCFQLLECSPKQYPVCSSEVQTDSSNCNRGNTLSLNCERGFIYITDVYSKRGNRSCNDDHYMCNNCCARLKLKDVDAKTFIANKCDTNSYCSIEPPSEAGRSYSVYYRCVDLNSDNIEEQTDSGDFPTVAVATSIPIIVVFALVIIVVVCVVRRRRQKKDGRYANNDLNHNNTIKSFSNHAYTSDSSDNILQKPSKSVERISSFSQDSGYAECRDVETDGAENGEYHIINFHPTTPNVDPAYSHIQKQTPMEDSTYSHITSESNTLAVASSYSNTNGKTKQLESDVNDTTYNTLQTHAVNKPPKCLPATDDVSENEYNHAVFTATSSKQGDNDTEYSHLKSTNNDVTNATPTQRKACSNDTEYAVVKNKNKPNINEDRVTDQANQKQERTNETIGKEDFVAEKEPGHDNVNATDETDSTSHNYFVLLKQ